MLKDFLIYGCSLILFTGLLFAFIKFTYYSIKNGEKSELKQQELLRKIEKVEADHNNLHKTQSNLNTYAYHAKLLNNDKNNNN